MYKDWSIELCFSEYVLVGLIECCVCAHMCLCACE